MESRIILGQVVVGKEEDLAGDGDRSNPIKEVRALTLQDLS